MFRHFLAGFLLALSSPPSQATIGIAIREVHFENNADYAKVFITLRNGTGGSSRSSTVVDIDALIYQNISSGLQLRMDLAAREAGSDHQYLTLLESTVDVCARDSSDDLLVSMMMDGMNQYRNLTIECPFETGNYAVRNFHIDTNNTLIRLAPPGEYRVGIDVKHQAENRSVLVPVFGIEFYANIFVVDH
ncbi:uncharacterized protein LOC120416699 [Culex pipiens pallens]|uniref:uncharacterized protein LOC120416699 n=1 Tax=Culex pipiens pallens TaxID=42434 RepID=UPI0022AA96FA|nr:uncharacterized protein LOC120416699 [Culex pipiens pallens]